MNIKEFYDDFQCKLIRDYYYGNPRSTRAIWYAVNELDDKVGSILDIGCGIGWSTFQMASKLTNTQVKGIDISEKLCQTANELFRLGNLEFEAIDVSKWSPESSIYDGIVMLDVYEHIEKNHRIHFHKKLSSSLKEGGKLILSCPTKRHQEWLIETRPEGLQPIDEIVEISDIELLAKDINGFVKEFKTVNIWHESDYFHATIIKNGDFKSVNHDVAISFENESHRYKRLLESGYETCLEGRSKTRAAEFISLIKRRLKPITSFLRFGK